MKNKFLILTLSYFLFSCTNSSLNNKSQENEQTKVEIDDSKPISIKDSKQIIKAKLKKIASIDNQEFGELRLFDEYYNSEITKYFLKDYSDNQRNVTVVVFNNKIRYMKMLLQHVGNTSAINLKEKRDKMTFVLNGMLEQGTYKRIDGKYMTITDNNETWNVVWIVSISKKTNTQDYWMIMTPVNELDYLKHMVNTFFLLEGFDTEFM